MVSMTEFVGSVDDAYEHLYDLVHLRTHPLAEALVPGLALRREEKAWRLHHLLLDAIEKLDPGPHTPSTSLAWRRHSLMTLRYEEGMEPQAVADELSISLRHYYRERKAAIEAVASVLRDLGKASPTPPHQPHAAAGEQEIPNRLELLRLEATRLAQAARYAHVDAVVRGVASMLKDMLDRHDLAIDLTLLGALPPASVARSLLRQMLMGVLGYLIERSREATIRLTARAEEDAVHIVAMVDPPTALHPMGQQEALERLSALEEMAELSGARIAPIRSAQSILGMEVRLPTTQHHTVLVVDDNRDALELFRRYLSAHDYRVLAAQTAQEGLCLAQQQQPQAIILDLMMPEQDGWDLMQILLNQPATSNIPIIVCSVLKQKELALSLGAAVFLDKPVSEQTLLSTLAALAGNGLNHGG
jgi:CheY-like chemotaxis protein